MKKLVILGVALASLYYYITWEPSTKSVVSEMAFGDQITHAGQNYHSDWADEPELINGYVRRIDRHYDKNIPIITYDLVLTTGDYSDPEIVEVKHKGGGNYFWSSNTQPAGSIVFYHTVPGSAISQDKLDMLVDGNTVEILAKVSQNSEITSDSGAYFKLMHSNHKILLVEDIN